MQISHLLECACRIWVSYLLKVKRWLFRFLQTNSKGHLHQIIVTSYVCSRKAPYPMDVNFWLKSFPQQDVVSQVVMLPVWAVPCLPSGWFGWLRVFVSTRLLQVAYSKSVRLSLVSALQKGPHTSTLSVCSSQPSSLSIPTIVFYQNVLLRCSVYDFLELLIEVVDLIVIIFRCRCVNQYDSDIEDWSAT